MKKTFHKAWKHILVTGICSLLFGIIALLWPAIPLFTLVWLFAAFMIIQGIAIIAGAWQTRREEKNWWLLLGYGLLAVLCGIIAGIYPGLTTIVLGMIISLYFLLGGILQVAMAIHLRKEIKGEGWLILSGLLTTVAGVYLFLTPGGGALAMLWLIAIAAILLGILFILIALRARHWAREAKDRIASHQE